MSADRMTELDQTAWQSGETWKHSSSRIIMLQTSYSGSVKLLTNSWEEVDPMHEDLARLEFGEGKMYTALRPLPPSMERVSGVSLVWTLATRDIKCNLYALVKTPFIVLLVDALCIGPHETVDMRRPNVTHDLNAHDARVWNRECSSVFFRPLH